MNIERLGVYERFPKLNESYINNISTHPFTEMDKLSQFIKGKKKNYYNEYIDEYVEYDLISASSDFYTFALTKYNESLIDLLLNKEFELDNFGKSLYLLYWHERFSNRERIWIINEYKQGKREQLHTFLSLRAEISFLGIFFSYGLVDEAILLYEEYLSFLEMELPVFTDKENEYHRRTQYFVLRLIDSWQDRNNQYPECAYDEPLFNELLNNWKTKDLDFLRDLLLAACDRHTHQCRPDSASKFYDLSWPELEYIPFEILTLLRLREQIGLENPDIDHPIMDTPLGKLHPIINGMNNVDGFLNGFLQQIKKEYPDFAPDFFIEKFNKANISSNEDKEKNNAKKPWQFWKR